MAKIMSEENGGCMDWRYKVDEINPVWLCGVKFSTSIPVKQFSIDRFLFLADGVCRSNWQKCGEDVRYLEVHVERRLSPLKNCAGII